VERVIVDVKFYTCIWIYCLRISVGSPAVRSEVFVVSRVLPQTRFGLLNGFNEHLLIVTASNYSDISNSHTLQFARARTQSIDQSLPGDGSQQCPLVPCSRSYRLAIVPKLTLYSNCPAYNISGRTHRKHRSSVTVQLFLRGPRRKFHSSVVVCGTQPSNGRCTVAYLLVAAQQRVYMPQ
jgi:hypothetical protein